MNFDLDDPLGDLLSDGSSDSFFEAKKKPSKSTTVKPSTPQKDKSKLKSLFDLAQDDPAPTPPAPPVSNSSSFQQKSYDIPPSPTIKIDSGVTTSKGKIDEPSTKKIESIPVTSTAKMTKKSDAFDMDSDEIDLGFNLKNFKSKSGILDDILGIDKKETPPPKPKPMPIPPKKEVIPMKTASRQPTAEVNDVGYAPSIGRVTSGRRGSANKLNDPLGLFSKEETPKVEKTKPVQADWLGLEPESHQPKVKQDPTQFEPIRIIEPPPVVQVSQIQPQMMVHPSQMLTISNKENENSLLDLRRQESQLLMAAQVKNQENTLFEMQKRQEVLLQQQQSQFNELLQKQLQRQQVIEENIKSQQQRINNHIQMLLSQPPTGISTLESEPGVELLNNTQRVAGTVNTVEMETDVRRLELEKLRLEDLISNVNANHEQEISFLEKSYKKQIELLGETMINLEQRMKSELDNLVSSYDRRLKTIASEKEQVENESNRVLTATIEVYESKIKKLKINHETEIEDIQREHKSMVVKIRESKLMEFSLLQESGSYLSTLQNASKYLENATGDLQHLKNNIQENIDQEYVDRKRQLEIREKSLIDQQEKFEKIKNNSLEERDRLMELVKTLEIKLDSVTRMSNEEEWRFKQKSNSFEVERASFEREKEFIRGQLKIEQKNFDELKKLHSIEFQKKLELIESEKMEILMEKSKLETISRVQKPPNPELSRIEIDAAVQVAQDAARQADVERERFMEMQRKCEKQKRVHIDKENSLRGKELELECSINSAQDREKNAHNALRSAKLADQKVKAKLQYLKNVSRDLSTRESNLAKQKLEISQERVDLQKLRNKLYESRCSLCKISDQKPDLTKILTNETYPTSDNDDGGGGKFDLDKFDVDRLDMMLDREVEASLKSIGEISRFEFDLGGIPNITDVADESLDPQMLLLKWDAAINANFLS